MRKQSSEDTPVFVRAKLETRHFEFEAYGTDRESAMAVLAAAWAKHCERNPDADRDYLKEFADDVQFQTFALGNCYRDGEWI